MKARNIKYYVEVKDAETPGFPDVRVFKSWSTAEFFCKNNPNVINMIKRES